MFKGLQEVIASVSDIARIARIFTHIANYRAVRLADAPREQWAAWRVPRSGMRIEQCLLVPPGHNNGAIRLVKFHGGRQRVLAPRSAPLGHGGLIRIHL